MIEVVGRVGFDEDCGYTIANLSLSHMLMEAVGDDFEDSTYLISRTQNV